MTAYRNLLAENPQLAERKFEKIFCYKVDEPVKENGSTIFQSKTSKKRGTGPLKTVDLFDFNKHSF